MKHLKEHLAYLIVLIMLTFCMSSVNANGCTDSKKSLLKNGIRSKKILQFNTSDVISHFAEDSVVHTAGDGTCDVSNRPLVNALLVPVGNISQVRTGFGVASAGNKVVIAGGDVGQIDQSGHMFSSRVDIFDIATNSWSVAELSQPRSLMSTVALGNKIFFAGGRTGESNSSRVDIYDAAANTWSIAELSSPRNSIAGVSAGNKIFFAGGIGTQLNVVDIYDVVSDTWSTSTLAGRTGLGGSTGITATAAGTKVYFAGGAYIADEFQLYSSTINIYDLVTNTWSTSDLSMPRGNAASVAVGNKIYWAGGVQDGTIPGNYVVSSLVEIRDTNTALSSFDCLSEPSIYLTAVLTGDKIVYLPLSNYSSYNKFDIYNTGTGTWSIGVLPVNFVTSSQFGISTISVNNTIYIAGGYVNGVLSNQLWKLEIQTESDASAGLFYKYYEGDFDALPEFTTLRPVKTGKTANVDINLRTAGVDDHFAFTWEGNITIPKSGTYTFETVSDDGSKLYFNGNPLVSNDGLHASNSATGTVTIAAGTYPILISYFEKDGGQGIQVYWTGPDFSRQLIPDAAFGSGVVTPAITSSGLAYKYYEGDFNALPDFSTLTPIKTGTSANADLSVRPSGVDDHFAFVWQGYINITTVGIYIFETVSDDGSKIYFNTPYTANSIALVNNDGLHPPTSAAGVVSVATPGVYPITITYFEKEGGQAMQLYWSGPGISRQPIPDAAFISDNAINSNGLHYKYYEGDFNVLPYYTLLVPTKTGITNNIDISVRPKTRNDYFAFMWDGYINLPTAGTYYFETISDDGSKLYVNIPYSVNGGTVNNDGVHPPASATATVTVASPGKYPIVVTYFEKYGGETMQLYWSGPGFDRQPVPDAAFTTSNFDGATAIMSGANPVKLFPIDPEDRMKTLSTPNIYPNPFIDNFTIDYNNSGSFKNKVAICIYDLNGKLIYNYQPTNISTGHNIWLINTGHMKLASGVYMAQLKINGLPWKILKLVKK